MGCLIGSLCDAVTGRTDGADLLEQIEQANRFLLPREVLHSAPHDSAPHDSAPQWYRYHTLFAEAMRREACRCLGDDALSVI